MKRTITFLLILSLLLCAAGCAATPTDPTDTKFTTAATTQPPASWQTEPSVTVSQQIMTAVSIPAEKSITYAQDGTPVFRSVMQDMQLVMPDQEVADRIIFDFLSRVKDAASNAEQLAAFAQSSYTGSSNWNAHFLDVLYDPMRIDLNVLSLYGESVTWSGGAHPSRHCITANYNMVTGDPLTLGSILYDAQALEPLTQLVIAQLEQIAEDKYLAGDYAQTVTQRLTADESLYEDWYFTRTGLCFCFSPYEIAPYASGVITAHIPYDQLTGLIDDAFFPVEYDRAAGSLQAALLSKENANSFSQIAEVILDPEGEMLLLYTQGALQDVRLDVGSMNEDGTYFTKEYTAFASAQLTPGDAVMVQLSKTGRTVCSVQYYSNDQTNQAYLIYENGTVTLEEAPSASISK